MITVEGARLTAEAYLEDHRPGCRFGGLLEDREDYLVVLEAVNGVFPKDGSWIFISKSTGRVREITYGEAFSKYVEMEPVVD